MYDNLYEEDESDNSDTEFAPSRFYPSRIIFENFTASQIRENFRLSPTTIELLAQRIGGRLTSSYENRSTDLTVLHQIKIALNFYGTGDHFKTLASANGITTMSVSRSIRRVTEAILAIGNEFIFFPTDDVEINEINTGFFRVMGQKEDGNITQNFEMAHPPCMPKVLGVIDGTLLQNQRQEVMG